MRIVLFILMTLVSLGLTAVLVMLTLSFLSDFLESREKRKNDKRRQDPKDE